MNISRPVAAIIGIVTAWPVLYFITFMAFMLSTMSSENARMEELFGYLFVAHLLTMLVTLALLAFYVVHLFKNDSMPSDPRLLWMLVLFFGNLFAFPVYWYLYVWRRPSTRAAV